MIMLTYWKNVDLQEYDIAYYATHSVPVSCRRHGVIHRPDLGPSQSLADAYYKGRVNDETFYSMYEDELRNTKMDKLKELVAESDNGKWIQVLFFEKLPTDGERPYMYKVLKELTQKVNIE